MRWLVYMCMCGYEREGRGCVCVCVWTVAEGWRGGGEEDKVNKAMIPKQALPLQRTGPLYSPTPRRPQTHHDEAGRTHLLGIGNGGEGVCSVLLNIDLTVSGVE